MAEDKRIFPWERIGNSPGDPRKVNNATFDTPVSTTASSRVRTLDLTLREVGLSELADRITLSPKVILGGELQAGKLACAILIRKLIERADGVGWEPPNLDCSLVMKCVAEVVRYECARGMVLTQRDVQGLEAFLASSNHALVTLPPDRRSGQVLQMLINQSSVVIDAAGDVLPRERRTFITGADQALEKLLDRMGSGQFIWDSEFEAVCQVFVLAALVQGKIRAISEEIDPGWFSISAGVKTLDADFVSEGQKAVSALIADKNFRHFLNRYDISQSVAEWAANELRTSKNKNKLEIDSYSIVKTARMKTITSIKEFHAAAASLWPDISEERRSEFIQAWNRENTRAAAVKQAIKEFKEQSQRTPSVPVLWANKPSVITFDEFMRWEYRDKGLLTPNFTMKDLRRIDPALAQVYYKQGQRGEIPEDIRIEKAKARRNKREKENLAPK